MKKGYKSSWGFHSNLTHEKAEKLLRETGIHGSYVCRRSQTTPGCYTLSVRRRNEINHYKIYNDGESFELYENDGFASVPDLIDYYRRHPDQFKDKQSRIVELGEPLVTEDDIGTLLDQESWFFGSISSDEARRFLFERGNVGSYLVRESRTQPGCYALSIRRPGAEIIEFLLVHANNQFSVRSGTTTTKRAFSTIQDLLHFYKQHPLIDKNTNQEVLLGEPLCESAERVRNDIRVAQEFEWLQFEDKTNTNPKTAGQMPCNRVKNRYKNILPFDCSRVVLNNVDPTIPGSDYINASYIFDDACSGLFIAAQGCLKATIDDFWRMVYQENSRIIIMVTNEIEKAKIKCVRYWPDYNMTMVVDGREVTNIGETSTGEYIIREFELEEDLVPGRNTRRFRKIFHYQYIGWPDHGVPGDPNALLDMLALIEATQKTFQYPGPRIVHCSAGIGRTGTVIVINLLLNLWYQKGAIDEKDVPQTVQKVRCQRGGMVQTEAQYRFIYQALVVFMELEKEKQQKELESNRDEQQNRDYSNLAAMSEMLRDLNIEPPNDKPPLPPRE